MRLFRKRYQQRQCGHFGAECIHGDEIHAVGGKRGYCRECGLYLDVLPPVCSVSGTFHASGDAP